MNKVLFSNSYFYKLDQKQWQFKQPYPPLGTIQAAALILACDFEVSLFDTNLRDDPNEILSVLKNENPDYLVIYEDGFNYLTKMCLTVMREAAFTMAAAAKSAGCIVIVSSSDASDHYEKYFHHGVDFVVRGEGEETLKELLTCLRKKEDTSAIKGLAFAKEGRTIVNLPRTIIRNLDSLPMAAWHLIDVEQYRDIWKKNHGYFSLNLATTRGCPFKCNWCAKPIYGNRYNSRSVKNVVTEISYLLHHYKPDHFWMCDDIFGLKPGWVQEFRDEVKKEKLLFHYKIQSRVDLLLEEDTIDALAQSGAETVWVGAESGSQKILDAMDKGTTVEQIQDASRLLKQRGIKVAFFLQFGYPGETQQDIQSTLDMVLELMPDEIGISVSYPLPGTVFYENVKSTLREKQNWKDSDDLSMMYTSTFGGSYYKKLHRYVHNRYRIQRGVDLLKKFLKKPAIPSASGARKVFSMLYNIPFSVIHARQLKQLSRTRN